MKQRTLFIALLLLAAIPFAIPSQAVANLAFLTALAAALGQSWNLAGGFGGMTSFGHAAFFGVGAYTGAILQTRYGVNAWLCLPAAALTGAAAGWIVGWAACRSGLRGSYLALVTLAIAEALRILANSIEFTRAGLGISLPLKMQAAGMQFADKRWFYAAALLLAIFATALAIWLSRSRFGARLMAVRENQDAAQALGVRLVPTQAAALALSAAIASMGGVLYLQVYLYIDPSIAFGVGRSVEMLLVALIGGAGTVLGPLVGAIVLAGVGDAARVLIERPGFAPALYGVVLLLIVGFMPNGLVGRRSA
jgi:branched-chain amino acid transport system permease protein